MKAHCLYCVCAQCELKSIKLSDSLDRQRVGLVCSGIAISSNLIKIVKNSPKLTDFFLAGLYSTKAYTDFSAKYYIYCAFIKPQILHL